MVKVIKKFFRLAFIFSICLVFVFSNVLQGFVYVLVDNIREKNIVDVLWRSEHSQQVVDNFLVDNFSVRGAKAAEVTIEADTTDATAEYGPSPAVVFTSDQIGYVFFVDSGNDLVYRKTTNGGTNWATPTVINNVVTGWVSVAVWYDQWTPGDNSNTKIHIAASDNASDDIYYTYLDTNGDTLKGSVVTAVSGSTTLTALTDGPPSITKGVGGNLFISGNFSNTAGGKVSKCTDGVGDSWSDVTPSGWSTVAIDQIQLLPLLTGDDIIAIKAETASNAIKYQIYDESNDQWPASWTSIATLTENTTYDQWFSATIKKSTGDVYLTFANQTNNVNNDIEFWSFDESSRGSGFVKGTNNVYDNSNLVLSPLTLTDEDTGNIYVVYISGRVQGSIGAVTNIYYKKSTDGGNTWSEEYGEVNNNIGDDYRYLRGNLLSNDRLFVIYHDDDDNDIFGTTIESQSVDVEANVDTAMLDATDEYGPSPSGVFIDESTGYNFFIRSNVNLDATDEFNASPSVVFTDANNGYAFFVSSINQDLVYARTTNGGANWSGQVIIDSAIAGWTNVAVWYDQWTPGDTSGTKIHIAASDDISDDIYYTYLDTSSNTLKGSMVTVIPGSATLTEAVDGPPSITKGGGGDLFMSANFTNTVGGKVYKSSDGSGDSWSDVTPSGWSTVAADQIQLLPLLTGNDVVAIKAETANDAIKYQIYDETGDSWAGSWTSIATMVDNATYDQWFSATIKKSTGDVYLTFANNTNNAANDIEFWSFDESDRGTGFVQKANVYDNSNTVMMPVPLVEEDTGNVYVAYIRGTLNSSVRVYYKSSTDGGASWSSESTTVSPTTPDDFKALRGNLLSNDVLYVVWYNDDTNILRGNNLLSPAAIDLSITGQGVAYRKTTDGGASWDVLRTVATAGGTVAVAVWYDQWTPGDTSGTKIHVVYSDDFTDDYYYTYLDTSSDTFPTPEPIVLGTAINETSVGVPGITKGAGGDLFLSGSFNTTAGGKVAKSTDGGDSWSDVTPSGWSTVAADQIQLLPLLTGNDVVAIKAETVSNAIKYQIYDESNDQWPATWTSIATLVDNATYDQWFSATIKKSTGDVYLAFTNNTNNVANDIEFWSFDESDRGTGFVQKANVYGDSNTVISPVPLMDENTGNIYVAYLRGSLNNNMGVYYKSSTDGGANWSTESENLSPGIVDDHKYIRSNLLSGERLYVFWHNDDLNDVMGNELPFLATAEVSITISTDGTVSFGGLSLEEVKDTTASGIDDVEVISVDSGPADLEVKSTVFTDGSHNWLLGASNGANQVKWELSPDGSSWTTFVAADTLYDLAGSVPQGNDQNLYFKITMPSSSDSYQAYSSTITIVASSP